MGSPADEPKRRNSEGPVRRVTIEPFFLGRYPVTQAQWRVVATAIEKVRLELDPDPSQFEGGDRPVEQVSWYEAIEFCQRLTKATGRRYRLSSEAEWEFACRAGTQTPFHFGETVSPELANYDARYSYAASPAGEQRDGTTAVAAFQIANAFGLCDMHGNVWEWCQDHWHQNYTGAPLGGAPWNEGEDIGRVLRGGSWLNLPRDCRSASRTENHPDYRSRSISFRVACALERGSSSRSD